MAKSKNHVGQTVYSVHVKDSAYPGNAETFTGLAANAGEAEQKALAAYRKKFGALTSSESPIEPYAADIHLVAELEF